jgi:hypothetical protein
VVIHETHQGRRGDYSPTLQRITQLNPMEMINDHAGSTRSAVGTAERST